MKQLTLFLLLTLTFPTFYARGQRSNFERYNHFINRSERELTDFLNKEKRKRKIEKIKKGNDSIRLVVRNRSPRETYTFFIINDKVKYVGVTFFKLTHADLAILLSSRFDPQPLENLNGDIFENYSNDKHVARGLFWNKEAKIGYLLVSYPELPDKYSNLVMWSRK